MMFQQSSGEPSADANLKEHLKGKTIEELRRELDVIFEQEEATGHEVDPSIPAAYFEAMQAIEPEEPETADFECSWKKFKNKHGELFQQRLPKHDKEKKHHKRIRVSRILEVAILAAAVLVLSAAAFRWPDYIITWGNELLRVTPTNSGQLEMDAPSGAGYRSLQEALDDMKIQEVCAPTWIPSNYSLSDIVVSATDVLQSVVASYQDDLGNEILVRISHYRDKNDMPDLSVEIDRDSINVDSFNKSHIKYQYTQNYGISRLTWVEGQCLNSTIGPITKDEITKIADSMYGGAT